MTADTAWQSEISFADRLETIVSITEAQQKTSVLPGDFNEAQSKAKQSEEHNFSVSKSREDYHKRCYETIQKLLAERKENPTPDGVDHENDDDDDDATGIDIGRYTNTKYYRDGLVSTVYKAKSGTGKYIALKITTPSIVTPPHDPEKEARVLRSSACNPNIIALIECFPESGGRLVLVFPFMPHDLASLLVKRCLTLDQARSHLKDMFNALSYLHLQDIIHRDVKPSNILLASPSGPAYLSDFGITWAPNDRGSEPADRKIIDVGTTCYRPPELLFGNTKYNTSLDLWAAGCVVAEVISSSHQPLFTSGPVGSELALIQSIFSTLGTPDLDVWPEAKSLPDWGKMRFRRYPARPWTEILTNTSESGRDLVQSLVRYESGQRIRAVQALQHPFLNDAP